MSGLTIGADGTRRTQDATPHGRGKKADKLGQAFDTLLKAATEATPRAATHIPLSGGQVLESVIKKQLQDIEKQAKQGDSTKDVEAVLAPLEGRMAGQDGGASANDGRLQGMGSMSARQYMDMLHASTHQTRHDNMQYLEMQQAFGAMTRQIDTISNLMRVRNEAVKNSVRGSQ